MRAEHGLWEDRARVRLPLAGMPPICRRSWWLAAPADQCDPAAASIGCARPWADGAHARRGHRPRGV